MNELLVEQIVFLLLVPRGIRPPPAPEVPGQSTRTHWTPINLLAKKAMPRDIMRRRRCQETMSFRISSLEFLRPARQLFQKPAVRKIAESMILLCINCFSFHQADSNIAQKIILCPFFLTRTSNVMFRFWSWAWQCFSFDPGRGRAQATSSSACIQCKIWTLCLIQPHLSNINVLLSLSEPNDIAVNFTVKDWDSELPALALHKHPNPNDLIRCYEREGSRDWQESALGLRAIC